MSAQKELKAMLRKAGELGCTVEQRRRHYQVRVPDGGIVTVSVSPSDTRAVKNARSDLRRAGLEGI